jgi:hypothetical protein
MKKSRRGRPQLVVGDGNSVHRGAARSLSHGRARSYIAAPCFSTRERYWKDKRREAQLAAFVRVWNGEA